MTRRPSPDADVNAGFPSLVANGDRLLAVWSVYWSTTAREMNKAVRVEWSSRLDADTSGWTRPELLLDRVGGETGGSLVALAADPRGGTVLPYERLLEWTNPGTADISLCRFDAIAANWGPGVKVGSGDIGDCLSLAVAADGTAYLTFDAGRKRNTEVVAITVPPSAAPATPQTVLTVGQDAAHGRSAVAVGKDERPWVVYLAPSSGADRSTEIRSLRGPWTAC